MNPTLPVDSLIPEIQSSLKSGRCLILQAAPGAGKTTRVPPALLRFVTKQILVLEPRRLAARLSAERVAQEMGESCGQTTGYQIRYDRAFGKTTRLKFITEGVFLRLLLSDPLLRDVECVVLDEFHERHIHTDVTLALVRHLQSTVRPDLKLVIMSATLDAASLQAYLPEARLLQSEGRVYPVDVDFQKKADPRSADQAAASAVKQLLARGIAGHVLVFLPGAAEIRRTAENLAETARKNDCLLLELRSETPPDQQRLVFEPSERRKLILATNVAETSLTIDGVTAIVDSGLARIPAYDSWNGLPLLETKPVSQASCIQRAGRAGRTAPGIALRLYTQHDYNTRPAAEKPEIQRLDLTQILLELKTISERFPSEARFAPETLPWFDAPPSGMANGCAELLRTLGAIDANGMLTDTGRDLSAFPLHPRLSRVIVEGRRLGLAPQAALAASLLNEGMILQRGMDADAVAQSDVTHQIDLLRVFFRGRTSRQLDAVAARRVERLAESLAENVGCSLDDMLKPAHEDALALALLAGFPDRVAQARRAGVRRDRMELALCTGANAVLSRGSCVRDSEFLIALEAEASRGHGEASRFTQIRAACGLEREMLLSGPEEFLREEESFYWDAGASRARGVTRLRYGILTLEEKQIQQSDPRLEDVLRVALHEQWPRPFDSAAPLESLQQRAALLKQYKLPARIPDFDSLLAHIAKGRKSFAEVLQRGLQDYLNELIPQKDARLLREHAPETITLANSRKVRVNYESGKPPWIASALQDFIGMRSTPRIAAGRVPLVVHLLAPNKRAVQVTQDLEGFWLRHYPELRKTLSRRYPKHKWP